MRRALTPRRAGRQEKGPEIAPRSLASWNGVEFASNERFRRKRAVLAGRVPLTGTERAGHSTKIAIGPVLAHCRHRGECEDADVTQKYPPAWSDLKYPWQRAELLAFLADAQKPSLYEDTSGMKFLMNFIFDDHDFKPAAQQLGWMLLDHDEVEAIAGLRHRI
jgi:hypothetical protein